MLIACWSLKGGAGVSTVVAAIAQAGVVTGRGPVAIADLCGDQALLHGVGWGAGAGLRGWTRAGPDVPPDALERLLEPLSEDMSLLGPGTGRWVGERAEALGKALSQMAGLVVADVGQAIHTAVGRAVVEGADRSVLVIRACPLSMRAVADLTLKPDCVVLVRDPRRWLGWREVAERCGVPVVAEIDLDPAVGKCADVGIIHRPLPKRFVQALAEIV
ncbi:MAG: hypothetical protein KDA95_00830 [Acidimicrobiales bacterium]|nr:hypothetical protein [Acidimicrobiales bacterium]